MFDFGGKFCYGGGQLCQKGQIILWENEKLHVLARFGTIFTI